MAGAAVVAAVGLSSSAAGAETLKQALSSAYKYNPRLDAERARLRATDEEVARAKSGYRPDINATGDVNVVNTPANPVPVTNCSTTSAERRGPSSRPATTTPGSTAATDGAPSRSTTGTASALRWERTGSR